METKKYLHIIIFLTIAFQYFYSQEGRYIREFYILNSMTEIDTSFFSKKYESNKLDIWQKKNDSINIQSFNIKKEKNTFRNCPSKDSIISYYFDFGKSFDNNSNYAMFLFIKNSWCRADVPIDGGVLLASNPFITVWGMGDKCYYVKYIEMNDPYRDDTIEFIFKSKE